jgi:hypothetical protein
MHVYLRCLVNQRRLELKLTTGACAINLRCPTRLYASYVYAGLASVRRSHAALYGTRSAWRRRTVFSAAKGRVVFGDHSWALFLLSTPKGAWGSRLGPHLKMHLQALTTEFSSVCVHYLPHCAFPLRRYHVPRFSE